MAAACLHLFHHHRKRLTGSFVPCNTGQLCSIFDHMHYTDSFSQPRLVDLYNAYVLCISVSYRLELELELELEPSCHQK